MTTERFAAFIDKQIEQNPIEARIIRKIIRACKYAGNPIVQAFDGDEYVDFDVTKNIHAHTREIFETVFNLDEVRLYTASGSFIFLVLGNEWDVLCDYGTSIDDILAPVNEYIDKYSD